MDGDAELLVAADIADVTFPIVTTNYEEASVQSAPIGMEHSVESQSFNDTPGSEAANRAAELAVSLGPKFLLTKFTLYETRSTMYVVGSNARESRFRMLEIDLTAPKDKLICKETRPPRTRSEIMQVLADLEEQNKSDGGLSKRLTAWGILGFVRFTEGYYMSVVTKRSLVALLGGHFIYHIDGTELVPLVHSSLYRKPDRRSEEVRYISTFLGLDLSRTFYFSHSYDITHTLQYNLSREKQVVMGLSNKDSGLSRYEERFLWNARLLEPIRSSFDRASDWCTAIIHGFIDQAKISVSGRSLLVTIIGRRSHYFAGARFFKRGVNDKGNVANEVETEQILCDHLLTSFHDPKDGIFNSPRFTSYVQHRGSIPLYWSQDVSNMSPKPPIELNAVDPFFSAAALHFDDMFKRYGSPLLILNLIKIRERIPRESKLLYEFEQCIDYLNQFLPEGSKMRYTSWDMSRASKSRDQEVIEFLENYADATIQATGFFHNGKNLAWTKIQDGVCRTNCIDCLDRTNAAQFVIGKRALGYQLFALGITESVNIEYDSDVVNLLTEMYHDHGDTIALQYGGSHLVNTMETYRQINQWSSHSRDMIESIRRFYSNSFVDSQRQDAINLFLGNFVWEEGKPMLWELTTDYFLHNSPFTSRKTRRSYTKWWVPAHLLSKRSRQRRLIEEVDIPREEYEPLVPYQGFFDNYWNEYYKPRLLTTLHTTFAYNMNSTLRYLPVGKLHEKDFQLSPFVSRKASLDARRNAREVEGSQRRPKLLDRPTSIREQAMKRASMIYQAPVIPKIISDKVFPARIKAQVETVETPEGDLSLQSSQILLQTLDEKVIDDDLQTQVEDLLDPVVPSETLKSYQDYVDYGDKSSETNSVHPEYERYTDFFESADQIVASQEIPNGDYETYRYYVDLSRSSTKVVATSQTEAYNHDFYDAWLATTA